MAKPRIGFLGMGAMGGPMARRLVQTGFSVTGYDVSEARAGMKPGSAVATVLSGTAGVPSLLIQQPERP